MIFVVFFIKNHEQYVSEEHLFFYDVFVAMLAPFWEAFGTHFGHIFELGMPLGPMLDALGAIFINFGGQWCKLIRFWWFLDRFRTRFGRFPTSLSSIFDLILNKMMCNFAVHFPIWLHESIRTLPACTRFAREKFNDTRSHPPSFVPLIGLGGMREAKTISWQQRETILLDTKATDLLRAILWMAHLCAKCEDLPHKLQRRTCSRL